MLTPSRLWRNESSFVLVYSRHIALFAVLNKTVLKKSCWSEIIYAINGEHRFVNKLQALKYEGHKIYVPLFPAYYLCKNSEQLLRGYANTILISLICQSHYCLKSVCNVMCTVTPTVRLRDMIICWYRYLVWPWSNLVKSNTWVKWLITSPMLSLHHRTE